MKHPPKPNSTDSTVENHASRGAVLLREFDNLGGGEILDAFPLRHKRLTEETRQELATLEKGSPEESLALRLHKAGPAGLSWQELLMRTNLLPSKLKPLIGALISGGKILFYDPERQRYIHSAVVGSLKRFCVDYLQEFHRQNPLQPGAGKEELKSKLPPQVDTRLFNYLLSGLIAEKKVLAEKERNFLDEIALRSRGQES